MISALSGMADRNRDGNITARELVAYASRQIPTLAIEHLNDEKSSIDLIICDIEMPGMDGWEFVHKLRFGDVPRYKNVPILMLTGVDTPKNIRRGKYHKIDAFLLKPPDVNVVRKHMLQALGSGMSA